MFEAALCIITRPVLHSCNNRFRAVPNNSRINAANSSFTTSRSGVFSGTYRVYTRLFVNSLLFTISKVATNPQNGFNLSKDLPNKVLLLLFDGKLCSEIKSVLTEAGFEVTTALESDVALKLLSETIPQFIIMNSTIAAIPDPDLRRNIRLFANMPETRIITLSEYSYSRFNRQNASFEADSVLHKPFTVENLLKALEMLQTRHPELLPRKVLTAGAIELVPEKWLVYVEGVAVNLTEKEYRLLQELMEVEGRVLTREALLERVWGYQKVLNLQTRTLDVHMSRLRTKLGSSAANIITVRNIGYRMNFSPEWLNQ